MSLSAWHRVICVASLAAVASALYGADGITIIDQSRAIAGSVTPGDAPGFPVTLSRPGSYRLAGNLTVSDPDTTAIEITAESVTVDLNGFSIIGPVNCTSKPTKCPPSGEGSGVRTAGNHALSLRSIKVMNGSVHGMGLLGIVLAGEGNLVERVTAYSNPAGGMSVSGTVEHSAAIQNGSFGIVARTVRDSTSLENVGNGIIIDVGGGIASGNVSSFNGGVGIVALFSTATNNTTYLNNLFGISASCPSTIVGNTVISGATATIETRGTGCVLANNATTP